MSTLGYSFLEAAVNNPHAQSEDTYLNSALYYTLTGRRGAKLYQSDHSSLVVCHHPHIPERLMIFPEVGRADGELTFSVLNMLSPPKNGIQLARYTSERLSNLRQKFADASFTNISALSEVEETTMDWRYPVRILDTSVVADMEGKQFAKIRNKVRKAEETITATPLDPLSDIDMMRAALRFWEGNMIFCKKETPDMSELYVELFRIFQKHPECGEGLLFMQGRKPIGFSVWDKPSNKTANILVNLSDTSVTGLSDFQLVSSCRHLAERGIKYANMGGSELQSLDSFKAKYQPAKTLKLVSAEVLHKKPKLSGVRITDIVKPTLAVA